MLGSISSLTVEAADLGWNYICPPLSADAPLCLAVVPLLHRHPVLALEDSTRSNTQHTSASKKNWNIEKVTFSCDLIKTFCSSHTKLFLLTIMICSSWTSKILPKYWNITKDQGFITVTQKSLFISALSSWLASFRRNHSLTILSGLPLSAACAPFLSTLSLTVSVPVIWSSANRPFSKDLWGCRVLLRVF